MRRSRKGMMLLLAMALVAVLAVIAECLVRISLWRTLVYRQGKESQLEHLAAYSAMNELQACLASQAYPPSVGAPPCAGGGWSNWSQSGGSYTSAKDFTLGPGVYRACACWNAAGKLVYQVDPPPYPACPSSC